MNAAQNEQAWHLGMPCCHCLAKCSPVWMKPGITNHSVTLLKFTRRLSSSLTWLKNLTKGRAHASVCATDTKELFVHQENCIASSSDAKGYRITYLHITRRPHLAVRVEVGARGRGMRFDNEHSLKDRGMKACAYVCLHPCKTSLTHGGLRWRTMIKSHQEGQALKIVQQQQSGSGDHWKSPLLTRSL